MKTVPWQKLVADEHDLKKEDIELLQNHSPLVKQNTRCCCYWMGMMSTLQVQIQNLIELWWKPLESAYLILTSRPKDGTDFTRQIKDKMDGEVEIEGFSEDNILRSVVLGTLECKREGWQFLKEAADQSWVSMNFLKFQSCCWWHLFSTTRMNRNHYQSEKQNFMKIFMSL